MSTNPGNMGRYELQEILGQGGMAEVWKAFDTQTRQYVAIKFLHANLRVDPAFAARFQREAQVIASLRHPNIVQYHDFFLSQPPGTGNTTASIVMDYVDGGSLGDFIRNTSRQGRFPPIAEVVRLFTSIGTAIDYAHQHGVVHGQLKPTNILLDRRKSTWNVMGEPVVTDFGIMKLLAITTGNTSGWWVGTPLYTSPEQIMGTPGDARSDIYALGIMLYEVCTGTPPFPGNNPATVIMQHINTVPAAPALINPAVPPSLVALIMRAIAKDPAQRFPTVSALLAELAQVEGQSAQPNAVQNSPVVLPASDANSPTIMSSGPRVQLTPPPGAVPSASLPAISGSGFSPFVASAPLSSPGLVGISSHPALSTPGAAATPVQTMFAPGQVLAPTPTELQSTVVLPPPPERRRQPRRRGLWIALSAILLVLVLGSGVGAYLLIQRSTQAAPAAGSGIVGHAYFVSSGLLSVSPESSQGITDELQIKLENIPQPPTGKNYYGWLLNAKGLEWRPIRLGALTVNNGTIVFSYPGDAQHSNLLSVNSRFLVTLGDVASPPLNPDNASLVYYAEFSETKHPYGKDLYSLYDHIRHLLSNDPKVLAAGLTGGLDIWLYRNTGKILEWSGSARDADLPSTRNLSFARRQLVRILDYLDGTTYAQRELPGQPLLVDPAIAKIGLLTFDPLTQDPPGYLYHMEKHLHEISSVLPEATAAQRTLSLQIGQYVNAVNAWDQTIHSDVLTLLKMNDTQLAGSQGLSLLNEIATLANNALVGQITPEGQVTGGTMQIHYAIQNLATFDVRACTSSNPCPPLV